jgi:hypothetical protein
MLLLLPIAVWRNMMRLLFSGTVVKEQTRSDNQLNKPEYRRSIQVLFNDVWQHVCGNMYVAWSTNKCIDHHDPTWARHQP